MEFRFEDYFLPMREEMVREELEKGFKGFFRKTIRKKQLESRILEESEKVKKDIEAYSFYKHVFDLIQSSKNNQIEKIEDIIQISGAGHTKFKINRCQGKNIKRKTNTKTGLQTTLIPLLNDDEEFNLLVYDQLDLENFEEIELSYRYKTNLHLKYLSIYAKPSWQGDDLRIEETLNPLKRSKYDTVILSFDSLQYKYFLKEKKKFYIRLSDAFCDEFARGIFGEWAFPFIKREHLQLESDIFTQSPQGEYVKIYSGEIKSCGAFPFLIYKDNNNPMISKKPEPKSQKELALSSN